MQRMAIAVGVLVVMAISNVTLYAKDAQLTNKQVKKAIIKESIASYPGNCPCPYSVARNGSSCGRRSAYSKPGGHSPICYEKDVSQEMIQEWRENHK